MTSIPRDQWQEACPEHGNPDMGLRLRTAVGDVVVSTCGDWRPRWPGAPASKPQPLGRAHLFETMVFPRLATREPCGCADMDTSDHQSQRRYMTREEAERGHVEECERVAAGLPAPDGDQPDVVGDVLAFVGLGMFGDDEGEE